MRSPFVPMVAATGFMSAVAQVVLLRQVLSLYGASEFCLALFWFFWFASNAIGVISAGRASERKSEESASLTPLLFSYVIAAVIAYFGLRFLPAILRGGDTAGNFLLLSLAAAPLVSLPNFLNGRIIGLMAATIDDDAPVRVFLIEALAFIAGAVFTLVFLSFVTDFFLLLQASLPVLCLCVLNERAGNGKTIGMIVWASAAVLLVMLCIIFAGTIERTAVKAAYPGYDLVSSVNTMEGRVDILSSGGERFALFAGRPLQIYDPPGTDEETVYPALSSAPVRPAVLIDGIVFTKVLPAFRTAEFGSMVILFHDRELFKIVSGLLPEESREVFKSGRVSVVHKSMQDYLRTSENKFDIIFSSQSGVGLIKEMAQVLPPAMRSVRNALSDNGIFCLILPPEGAKVGKASAYHNRGIFSGLIKIFPGAEVMLLNTVTLMLGPVNGKVTAGIEGMLAELKRRGIKPRYFNMYDTGSRLANAASIGVKEITAAGVANSFDTPVSAAWGLTRFFAGFDLDLSERLSKFYLGIMSGRSVWLSVMALLLVSLVVAVTAFGHARGTGAFLSGAVFPAMQMVLVYVYQAVAGDVYSRVGLLIGIFMAGTAAAFLLAERAGDARLRCLPVVMALVSAGAGLCAMTLPWARIFVCAGIFTAGLGQGFLFKYAAHSSSDAAQVLHSPGGVMSVYVSDLSGSLVANLLVPLFMVPVFGFRFPLLLSAGLVISYALTRFFRKD